MNYLSILIAALLMVGIGYLWYGPVFGKYWMKLKGYTPESMKAMKMSARTAMILTTVAAFVMTLVLALLVQLTNPLGVGGVLMLTFLVWVGFVATTMSNQVLFEDGDVKLYFFHIAYYFVSILAATSALVFI